MQIILFLSFLVLSAHSFNIKNKLRNQEEFDQTDCSTAIPAPKAGCVWLFQNFLTQVEVCQNTTDLRTLNFDKTVLAIQLGQNTQVTLWNNYNYAGNSRNWNSAGYYQLLDFPCSTSSVQISSSSSSGSNSNSSPTNQPACGTGPAEGCIWLFQNYLTYIAVCQATPDLRTVSFDKSALAVQVGPNTKATLWANYNNAGDSRVYNSSGYYQLLDFPCSTSSVQVASSRVVIYSMRGWIKNAQTNQPFAASDLSSVAISFTGNGQTYNAIIIAQNSTYSIQLSAGTYTRNATLTNYVPSGSSITVSANTDETNADNSVLFSVIFQGWRSVLSWNTKQDLDAYTKLPNGEIVYYKNKISKDKSVTLDVDNRDGSGPETTTFNFNTSSIVGNYNFYVNSYSQLPLNASLAKVTVYHGSLEVVELQIPSNVAGALYWNVFAINVAAGGVQTYSQVNQYKAAMN